MGLPIFITPAEPEVTSGATEKVAASQRSSIRRQRTIRGGPQGRSAEIRRRRIQDTLDNEARENQRTNEPDLATIAALQARADRYFENGGRAFDERGLLAQHDPLSWERQHPAIESLRDFDSPTLPPAPDPQLEARVRREREIEHMNRVRRELRRMGRRRPAPTPPYTETDMIFMGRGRDSPRPSSLTPARSPARLSPPEGDAETSSVRHDQESDFAALVAARASRYREIREGQIARADRARVIDETRPLRGSSFREFLQRNRMDGLGDRDRSPEGGEVWDTLLTSITPDPQPPSAGSSFASSSAAAAAASSSTSNTVPTWGSPLVTSPERRAESPDHDGPLRDCDEPTSSDSNTEDDDGELEGLNVILNARPREDRTRIFSYADIARASRGAQSPDSSLEGMHRIISRLAERDDIPESWWASVGLRREPSA